MRSSIRGLFINNRKAQDSIYESGLMVYKCLHLSNKYGLDYLEISLEQRDIPGGYDFYFFNYHPSTMPWLETKRLKRQLKNLVITMVLEVLPGDPFVLCPRNHFHVYCVLDPSLKPKERNVFAFPRPLEHADLRPYPNHDIPVIGTFGFATKGKGFHHVVESVNKEFDRAVVRINIPFGNFVADSEAYSKKLSAICKERAKAGVQVIVTHNYYTKEELIDWCSANTLNCFLYDRNMPGLAATTDQAIVSGRPLAISKNDTFRHILSYLPPYPDWSLKQSIEQSPLIVAKIKSDWSPENFALKFEEILLKFIMHHDKKDHLERPIELSVKKNGFLDNIERKFSRYKRKLTVRNINQFLAAKLKANNEELL